VILVPNKAMAFKLVMDGGFPGFEKLVAVVVEEVAIIDIVLPDCGVAVGSVGCVIGVATSKSFSVKGIGGVEVGRGDPMLIIIVGISTLVSRLFEGRKEICLTIRRVRGWEERCRTMGHGGNVGCYKSLYGKRGDGQARVCKFRLWNCVNNTITMG
jgi:hypothetical protein